MCLDAATGERVWHFQFVPTPAASETTPPTAGPVLLDMRHGVPPLSRRLHELVQVMASGARYSCPARAPPP